MIGNKNKNREFKMKDKFMHAKIKLIIRIKRILSMKPLFNYTSSCVIFVFI